MESVQAGTAVRLDTAALTRSAALVVEGRVLASRALESSAGIETEHLLEVERTFKGVDLPHRVIRVPGGVLKDGRGMLLSGMPRICPGEDVLLFLSPESPNGVRMPVGLAQGKYTVLRRPDGTKALVRDAAEVALVDRRTGALERTRGRVVRDYAETVARIEAALVRKESR